MARTGVPPDLDIASPVRPSPTIPDMGATPPVASGETWGAAQPIAPLSPTAIGATRERLLRDIQGPIVVESYDLAREALLKNLLRVGVYNKDLDMTPKALLLSEDYSLPSISVRSFTSGGH